MLADYLNNRPIALPVIFPTALRAMRLPIVPFFTAFTSPKNLANAYRKPLVLLMLIRHALLKLENVFLHIIIIKYFGYNI